MVLGIDLAGVVETSTHRDFAAGEEVILNGFGLSETHFGGYAGKARVKGDWLVKLPEGLTRAEAMAIGTAGYTAMLCVQAIEAAGHDAVDGAGDRHRRGRRRRLDRDFPAGGRGMDGDRLDRATGEADYLKAFGAAEIIERATLSAPGKPLGQERWAAGVDSVGSTTLANVLAQTRYGGAVAACGLAGGMDLPTTVAPFILRGVRLLGVDSVNCPMALRRAAWDRLARDLDRKKLAAMTETFPFDRAFELGARILKGELRGRVVLTIA